MIAKLKVEHSRARCESALSIHIKSEGSILLEETVIRTHCLFKLCGAMHRTESLSRKDVACDFVLARSGKNLCSSFFFDFRMTIECAVCY